MYLLIIPNIEPTIIVHIGISLITLWNSLDNKEFINVIEPIIVKTLNIISLISLQIFLNIFIFSAFFLNFNLLHSSKSMNLSTYLLVEPVPPVFSSFVFPLSDTKNCLNIPCAILSSFSIVTSSVP
jgi:hypothetical protein